MLKIAKSRCVGCGKCCRHCVMEALELVGGKSTLTGKCIECGHCVSLRPQKAPYFEDYDMSEVIDYNKDTFKINADNLLNFIKFRRTIRFFTPQPVTRDNIEKIIEAGRYSPTQGNAQNLEYIVLQKEKKKIEALALELFRKAVLNNGETEGKETD